MSKFTDDEICRITLRRHLVFDAPCLSHDDPIELKDTP